MIYTIGYQRLTSRRLERIVGDLNAILVDCRYRPFSQRPEFGGDRLAEQFGTRYQQRVMNSAGTATLRRPASIAFAWTRSAPS